MICCNSRCSTLPANPVTSSLLMPSETLKLINFLKRAPSDGHREFGQSQPNNFFRSGFWDLASESLALAGSDFESDFFVVFLATACFTGVVAGCESELDARVCATDRVGASGGG